MTKHTPFRRRRATAATAGMALFVALTLAGCAAGNDAHAGTKTTLTPSAQKKLDALYKGTSVLPAADAPAPQPNKNIWIISIGQAVDIAAQTTGAAADAAEKLGWHAKIYDAQFQPNLALEGVQQAIAARADGIILYGIDCATVKTGLEEAKAAGIPVVGSTAQDCPSESLLTELNWEPAIGDFSDLSRAFGAAGALWLVSQTDTNATFIELTELDTASTSLSSQGYRDELRSICPDCTNVPVEFTAGDIGPKLQQKVQQALLQHPDATGLIAPYDAVITSGVSAAVMASGRSRDIKVIGGGGSVPNLDLIREGRGQNADIAYPANWEGFAAIDFMNRLLNGETPTAATAPTGIGLQLVDRDHNLPVSGAAPATVDFEAAYLKAWGVG